MPKRKIISSLSTLCICALLTLLLVFEDEISVAALEALSLSVRSVIPALFPYMVVSSVIISQNLLLPIFSHIPTEKLFGLPRSSAEVILCGFICGFPVGALGAKRLYENGSITKSQAAKLWAISSQTSPSFLIGVVAGWWKSVGFGVFLYLMQIVFALFAGIIITRKDVVVTANVQAHNYDKSTFIGDLCRGISDSALSCLAITGYIVFFRVFAVIFSSVFPSFKPLFLTVFEFSTGAFFGSTVSGTVGAFVTGFAVGFSGLAVFMQCVNFTEKLGIPSSCYFKFKLWEGVFLGASSYAFACFFPLSQDSSVFAPVFTTSFAPQVFRLLMLLAVFSLSTYTCKRN